MTTNKGRLIHAAQILLKDQGLKYLFLRQVSPNQFAWFLEQRPGQESDTPISADQVEIAIHLARQQWNQDSFRLVGCGFRYSLPERDEHGQNALFYQMAASYSNPTGVYYDETLGHNCIVQFASAEARALLERLLQNSLL